MAITRLRWSRADDMLLRRRFANTPTAELARQLERSYSATAVRACMLGLRKSAEYFKTPASGRLRRGDPRGPQRRLWTAEEDAALREKYPHMKTAKVAELLGRSQLSTYQRAQKLGLAKTAEYLASPDASRLRRGDHVGAAYRFTKGHTPANKGLRRPGWAPGRMRETQFRKGERRGVATKLWKPIGTERTSKDGYRERKINDDLPLQRRWRAVHVLLWESVHGPLPPGHAIAFRNRDKTDIRLENLELVSRAEMMRRNSVHNLPAPLPQTIQLLGALNRKINKATRRAS